MTDPIPEPPDALRIEAPTGADDRGWLALRQALWPEASSAEHVRDMADLLRRGQFVRLARSPDGAALGLIEASQRVDYVNGTRTSPVAFVEGLYVDPCWRRRGAARALVRAVEAWAAEQRCAELASDALLDNVAAHAAHVALGFEETERVVYFRRAVRRPP